MFTISAGFLNNNPLSNYFLYERQQNRHGEVITILEPRLTLFNIK